MFIPKDIRLIIVQMAHSLWWESYNFNKRYINLATHSCFKIKHIKVLLMLKLCRPDPDFKPDDRWKYLNNYF